MIAYDLKCANGHCFEGWFEDNEAFTSQHRDGLVSCPVCNDDTLTRMPSTFAIKSTGIPKKTVPTDIQKIVGEVSDYIDTHFDNVGVDFTKEALKIHYGVTEPRNIRGVSTKDEEKILKDEGVKFMKFPMPVKDRSES